MARDNEGLGLSRMVYVSALSIAAVLGTGILALPVRLGKSGFWPFACLFLLSFLAQVAVVALMTELLQCTEATMADNVLDMSLRTAASGESTTESPSLSEDTGAPALPVMGESDPGEPSATEGASPALPSPGLPRSPPAIAETAFGIGREHEPVPAVVVPPIEVDAGEGQGTGLTAGANLHAMGNIYLGSWGQKAFSASVVIHFLSILISYALAGSKAICQVS